jgi:hypothetical protein
MKTKMPSTRDRFIGNPLARVLAPTITRKEPEMYNHDKLVVKDIEGAVVNTYGRQKQIQGRNYMDLSDIDRSKPQ